MNKNLTNFEYRLLADIHPTLQAEEFKKYKDLCMTNPSFTFYDGKKPIYVHIEHYNALVYSREVYREGNELKYDEKIKLYLRYILPGEENNND